ncbi:divalent-cation tolerance protein CutA [Nesterenkonia pannonica]|uniref:divalent-cation tolerance protein CutA n=1 Tax=Nesterenkonia pannonica TaxID=1548602 RepID=UPI0021641349|nr:divalent-cation tolerance protein CutA [Nesterenkonia pannonica]
MHEQLFAAVQTTVSSEPEAEALARRIIEERLAACVQVTQVRSYYRWDGVQSSPEQLLTCKTASRGVGAEVADRPGAPLR